MNIHIDRYDISTVHDWPMIFLAALGVIVIIGLVVAFRKRRR